MDLLLSQSQSPSKSSEVSMDTPWLWLLHAFLSFYSLLISLIPNSIKSLSIFSLLDAFASLYFRFCHLSSSTLHLHDRQTTVHIWSTHRHRRSPNKPNLLLIHGYGGDSRWQFLRQVRGLSHRFNLFIPDLLFFGQSYTSRKDRTVSFQAECAREGLRRLGVESFSVYGISYGGYVAHRMAETWPEIVEKVVIVSSGVGATEEQIEEHLNKIGRNALDLLLPEKPDELRRLMNFTIFKFDPFKWLPNFLLHDFINVLCKNHRKEKKQLLEHLMMAKKLDPTPIPPISQETMLIWGDKDQVFPLPLACQLHRQLGPKSKLHIIKDTGHAANIDSPRSLNELIISFILAAPS